MVVKLENYKDRQIDRHTYTYTTLTLNVIWSDEDMRRHELLACLWSHYHMFSSNMYIKTKSNFMIPNTTRNQQHKVIEIEQYVG